MQTNRYRTHTCGQLRLSDAGKEVTLSGWLARIRDLGGMIFIDLRDQHGFTQLMINSDKQKNLADQAEKLGREFVVKVQGTVSERSNKNPDLPTGDIEILLSNIEVLNPSDTPPFTIEDQTDGGEELRMKHRYLDLRRNPVKEQMLLRHKISKTIREYLEKESFTEIETPFLIRSTPEGARDFIVPSRIHPGKFYALPQSPQTFKQLLMVGGFEKYFQFVRCFRDEDFRADRQPEFTQVDCEMAFVTREDVLNTFEGLLQNVIKKTRNVDTGKLPRLSWHEAMEKYGTDKPDLRFEMPVYDLCKSAQNKGFKVFDSAEYVGCIAVKGCSEYSRKQLDSLTEFVKKPQIGARGLVYLKCNTDGTFKSSVDKFFSEKDFNEWMQAANAEKGDLLLILAGEKWKTLEALGELRLEMAKLENLIDPDALSALWVVDFPLFEKDEESGNWTPRHHPFTAPVEEDAELLNSDPGKAKANAYDLVLNGYEIAGGSIRIHNREMQEKIFDCIGITREEAIEKFGFLLDAFRYGAPPHGGIAFGFDRLCTVLGKRSSIRQTIAFPKNNAGRDLMIDAPATINPAQLNELGLSISPEKDH